MMTESRISFDAMPQMLADIAEKLMSIEAKVDNLTVPLQDVGKDEWFNLKGLCDYLPSHPAEQTVYGWTSTHFIPFHKKERILPSLSLKLTNGYSKAIGKASQISCWRQANSLIRKSSSNNYP